MRKFILLSLFPVLIWACSQNNTCRIKGELPNDLYDGEYVYLVPFAGHSSDNVDSVRIKGNRFFFENKVDTPIMYVLRLSVTKRLGIEQLLVINEPGVVKVHLDSISSVNGTKENELLQEWKEQKHVLNKRYSDLIYRRIKTPANEREQINIEIEVSRRKEQEYHQKFVDEHQGTIVADFIAKQFIR